MCVKHTVALLDSTGWWVTVFAPDCDKLTVCWGLVPGERVLLETSEGRVRRGGVVGAVGQEGGQVREDLARRDGGGGAGGGGGGCSHCGGGHGSGVAEQGGDRPA